MRRLAMGTLLLLFCAGLAQASPGERPPATLKRQSRAAELQKVADSKPLFYSLGSDVSVAGVRQVRFMVEVDGRPALRETIAVPAGQAAGGSFELLAARPDLLDRLYALAGGDKRQVTVSISGDGRELRTFSFADFVTYNRRIKTSTRLLLQPRKSEVEVLDASAVTPVATAPAPPSAKPGLQSVSANGYGWQLDQGCVQSCDYRRQECIDSGGCGNTDLCDPCEDEYNSCVNYSCWAWVCTDPKSQSTSNVAQPVNAYWQGPSCLDDGFGNMSAYDKYLVVYKVYRITHTEYCNGTSSDSSVYLYDTYGYCIDPTGFSCSSHDGYVSGQSICY